ncbi:MAG TPA: pilin [Candidatus Saccharimonadales bacterium]|nr:pilin [Candidatus Saccharimonadales bacterium]
MKSMRIRVFLSGFLAFSALALGLTAPAFAQSPQDQINNGLCTGSNLQFTSTPGACSVVGGEATSKINNIIHTIVNILTAIVGIVAVIMIIVGGLRYITSGGNDTSVTSAKNTILYAIIGLVVVALAQLIVRFTLSKLTNS